MSDKKVIRCLIFDSIYLSKSFLVFTFNRGTKNNVLVKFKDKFGYLKASSINVLVQVLRHKYMRYNAFILVRIV